MRPFTCPSRACTACSVSNDPESDACVGPMTMGPLKSAGRATSLRRTCAVLVAADLLESAQPRVAVLGEL